MFLFDLFSKCVCGEKYIVSYILLCKKGGFVVYRYDGVCNLLILFFGNVFINVKIEL